MNIKLKILKASDKTMNQIPKKFGSSENNQKIAKRCLSLCEEWAIIKGESLIEMNPKQAKACCKKYVKNALESEQVGNIFISIILGIIVKLIVDWIVNNFIYNLCDELCI